MNNLLTNTTHRVRAWVCAFWANRIPSKQSGAKVLIVWWLNIRKVIKSIPINVQKTFAISLWHNPPQRYLKQAKVSYLAASYRKPNERQSVLKKRNNSKCEMMMLLAKTSRFCTCSLIWGVRPPAQTGLMEEWIWEVVEVNLVAMTGHYLVAGWPEPKPFAPPVAEFGSGSISRFQPQSQHPWCAIETHSDFQ